ncbi:polysaccharide pyruvyl transferase family protein [Sporosarcina thermotolerans]|uniref:polysaccharide pyruvyl transferase family protein n=1 Tax=Sporosarcina thermotolerans TaxID=633404 RepID=UPI00321BD5DA
MKIVISGFYGLGNTGDEAILKAIVDNLRAELDNPDITVFSLSPDKTSKEHGVESVYRGWRHENKEKVAALRKADLLISGGGGLLQDTYPTKFFIWPATLLFADCFVGEAMRNQSHVLFTRNWPGYEPLGQVPYASACQ